MNKDIRKICNVCNLEKDIAEYYFRKEINSHRNECKMCYSERMWLYRKRNLKRVRKARLKWQKENKDKKAVIAHRYYLNNKKKVLEYVKKWKRTKKPMNSRVIDNYRSRLHKAVKRKSQSTRELIGCDIQVLKNHIEKQFTKGMKWENYGEWHIDHIKPCAAFDFEDEKQIKECFNYTNLQPLWAFDNLKKKDRITGKEQG